MKRLRRCETCRHGIPTYDGQNDDPFMVCSLIPPTPLVSATEREGKMVAITIWVRPPMALLGWCGQHRLSLRRLFGYGTRA